ncbi:hypothetical protein [Nonomuraea sp. NPDC050202]|uniref:hypothetical protein n=1 Tax=Nonomuraea sp. NPDC050202 TaxID=3155035 RepID=UPI0033D96011
MALLDQNEIGQIHELQQRAMQGRNKTYLFALAEQDLLTALDALNYAATIERDENRRERCQHVAGILSELWERGLKQ